MHPVEDLIRGLVYKFFQLLIDHQANEGPYCKSYMIISL